MREPGTLSPAQRQLTAWIRLCVVSAGRLTEASAKAIRVVMRQRDGAVVLRVTDGEWHAAETFPAANTERAVLPAAQRCLGAVLDARDGATARRLVRDALAASG